MKTKTTIFKSQKGVLSYVVSKALKIDSIKLLFIFCAFISIQNVSAQCSNEALDFDGVNDQVYTILTNSYDDLTISAWFNASSILNNGNEDRIFSLESPRLEVGLEDDQPSGDNGKLWIYDQSTGNTMSFPTGNLHDDTWHQVVFRKKETDRTIFLDGQIVGSWVTTNDSFTGKFTIGDWPGGTAFANFKGMIDEVAFYSTALNDLLIMENWDCPLTGNEAYLIGYYPFENGDPGNNNTSINTTPDESLFNVIGDMSLSNFTLTGSTSNFICPIDDFFDPLCGISCDVSCDTTTLNLSTGVDITGTPIVGQHTSKWRVVQAPPSSGVSVSPPLFPYVLNTPSPWSDIPGAYYISPFPEVDNDYDNISDGTSFDFETCFCVCEDKSSITIDLSAYADNAVNVDLYNGSISSGGTFMSDLLDISSSEGTGAFNGPTFDVNRDLTVNAGQYCLNAKLQNDGTVYMGLSMHALVTGAGLIKTSCCGYSTNGATGYVYDDKNCNGNYDMNSDGLLTGIQIELCDDNGTVIATTTTDTLGLYTFEDIGTGMFSVKYVSVPDYEVLESAGTFAITENEVVGGLNFGLNNTGPLTIVPFETTCIQTGANFNFEWCGQSCDCNIQIFTRPCGSSGAFDLIGSVPNERNFTWNVPNDYIGDYEFKIVDCNGNESMYASCLTIGEFELDIQITKTDCGVYDFSSTLTGTNAQIESHFWSFGSYLTSEAADPTQEFTSAGSYLICLRIILEDGCVIREYVTLEVTEGSDDNCNFCPPNVLSEVVDGDLFIHNDKFGVIIQSPNGSCFRITVSDDGSLITQPVACP